MNEVERHSVTGYGRQDINYNDPEGEFVYYEDYAALKDSAMEYAYRWGKAQDDIKKAHMLHSMQKEEIASLKERLTNAQEALKSAGIEADTVQAGVMELVSRMNQVVAENALMLSDYRDIPEMRRIGAPLTPATDAYLNSVRVDAVVTAAAHLGDIASGKSTSTAELIKSCGRALLAYAAQLRAGNAGCEVRE